VGARDTADRLGVLVHGALAGARLSEWTDGELLARFVSANDHEAFAELVRRLGPAVYGVCLRVLGSRPDAEDAFQVAFLVLARKAAKVRPPGRVSAWLHGVAVLAARKARRARERRGAHEGRAAHAGEPAAPAVPDSDFARLLDEEIERLPERYRLPFVLCAVRELTVAGAATELGWPVGTVASRLSRGRHLLAARLKRRGVTCAAAGGLGATANVASASAPARLVSETVSAVAAGSPASGTAATLLHEVLRAMMLTKVRGWCAALLLCATACLGAVGLLPASAAPPLPPLPPVAEVPVAAPVPAKQETTTGVLFGDAIPKGKFDGGGLGPIKRNDWWLVDADGKNPRKVQADANKRRPVRPVDRTVVLNRTDKALTLLGPDGGELVFSLTDGPMAKAKIQDPGQGTAFAFDPEGAAVWFGNAACELCRIELATKELTVLKVNKVHQYYGVRFSTDGKRIAYVRCGTEEGLVYVEGVFCVDPDGKSAVRVTGADDDFVGFSFLADGRLAVADTDSVRAFDSKTGKGEKISGEWKKPLTLDSDLAFSPDGATFFSRGEFDNKMVLRRTKTGTATVLKKVGLITHQPPIMVRVPKMP
jgi:RNA polymerase sigma factor (sigma-70 family)